MNDGQQTFDNQTPEWKMVFFLPDSFEMENMKFTIFMIMIFIKRMVKYNG